MESVKSYFNGTGFERWNKIYGETDDVNKARPPGPLCCSQLCYASNMSIFPAKQLRCCAPWMLLQSMDRRNRVNVHHTGCGPRVFQPAFAQDCLLAGSITLKRQCQNRMGVVDGGQRCVVDRKYNILSGSLSKQALCIQVFQTSGSGMRRRWTRRWAGWSRRKFQVSAC